MRGPADLDIDIYQGASFKLPFECLDDDDVAVSIAGATIRGKVKNDINDTSAIFTFTGAVTDGPNGEGELTLSATTTAAWAEPAIAAKKATPTKYIWDAEIEFSDGQVQRIFQGFAYIYPEVSNA